MPAATTTDQEFIALVEAMGATKAAALLGVQPDTIRQYVEKGYLACRRLPSGHRRFQRSNVEALLSPEPELAQ